MTSNELRKKFLEFFKAKDHVVIPSASLVPENDPTVLFTTAGMHPLVPFLLGEKHPGGKRLANVQTCVRTDDIDEVGDETHHTFFEMLGNWSLGDYFKKEAIEWSYEFLTSKKWLGLDKEKLAISFFKGDDDAPEDKESKEIWLNLGILEKRIKGLSKKDNWWGPAGQTGPCGPDTEMFYWSGSEPAPKEFNPQDKKWVEIWNDVFMQYFKNADGKYEPLAQKNIDTGMGLERVLRVANGTHDDYQTDVFLPLIQKIEELSGKQYGYSQKITDNYGSFTPNLEKDKSGDVGYISRDREMRIIADHVKASVFIIGDRIGTRPSNVGQGYIVRRLIRRAILYGKVLNMPKNFLTPLIQTVVEIYGDTYLEIKSKENDIITIIQNETEKFEEALEKGLRKIVKWYSDEGTWDMTHPQYKAEANPREDAKKLGINLFKFFQESAIPLEISLEEIKKLGKGVIDESLVDFEKEIREGFQEAFRKHQELSRTASSGMFKGGLADTGEVAVRYHTATHLLLAALRQVLGSETYQKGSNITAERLRFDFNYSQKLTEAQIKEVEDLVNQKIKEAIKIEMVEMPKNEAMKIAKISFDSSKYGDMVKVYKIGDFSIELCGGPHVKSTAELGHFKIVKEEASSSGVRRIRAILEDK